MQRLHFFIVYYPFDILRRNKHFISWKPLQDCYSQTACDTLPLPLILGSKRIGCSFYASPLPLRTVRH
jgi:hypothetical protein